MARSECHVPEPESFFTGVKKKGDKTVLTAVRIPYTTVCVILTASFLRLLPSLLLFQPKSLARKPAQALVAISRSHLFDMQFSGCNK